MIRFISGVVLGIVLVLIGMSFSASDFFGLIGLSIGAWIARRQ